MYAVGAACPCDCLEVSSSLAAELHTEEQPAAGVGAESGTAEQAVGIAEPVADTEAAPDSVVEAAAHNGSDKKEGHCLSYAQAGQNLEEHDTPLGEYLRKTHDGTCCQTCARKWVETLQG
jgi:hypothetical protein